MSEYATVDNILDTARAYMDTHNPMQHWMAWGELRAILDGKPVQETTQETSRE